MTAPIKFSYNLKSNFTINFQGGPRIVVGETTEGSSHTESGRLQRML